MKDLEFKDKIIIKLQEENEDLKDRNTRLSNINKFLVERFVEMKSKKDE